MRISDWSSDVCSSDLFFNIPPPAASHFRSTIRGMLWRTHSRKIITTPTMKAKARQLCTYLPASVIAEKISGPRIGRSTRRPERTFRPVRDRKSVGEGKRGSVRVYTGGSSVNKKKKNIKN